jgi:hypothetical protein
MAKGEKKLSISCSENEASHGGTSKEKGMNFPKKNIIEIYFRKFSSRWEIDPVSDLKADTGQT